MAGLLIEMSASTLPATEDLLSKVLLAEKPPLWQTFNNMADSWNYFLRYPKSGHVSLLVDQPNK